MHLEMCFETACFKGIQHTKVEDAMHPLSFLCTRIKRFLPSGSVLRRRRFAVCDAIL
jgi:hypothetical protein